MPLLPKHINNEMRWYLILFLLAALGGAVRKWGTSSGAVSNVILGLQMIVPFLMVYFRSPNCYTPFSQHKILIFYFFYLAFHIIHPLQLTFMHGVFGILVHGGFWLGIFYYFSNRHLFDPRQYMGIFLIVAIIEVVLAFIQYQLPPNHILNKYASDLIEVATVGDRVRVTGTFSYLSGYTAYTMFFALMIWGMIRMRLPQWMIFTAIPAGLIATFMTGSRSGLVIYFLFVGGILFTEYPAGRIFSLLGRLIIPAMIFTAVILLYKKIPIFEQAELAYDNFMARVEANQRSGEQNARFTTDLWYLQNGRFKSPIIGVGLGSTYQGATQLFGTSRSVLEFGYVETELTRIILEGGVLLVLFKLSLGLIMALNLSFGGFMRWAVWLVVAFAQPIVYNPHNAAFLLLGIILVDNVIWRQKIERKHRWEQYQKAQLEAAEAEPAETQPAPIAVSTTT